MYYIYLFFKLYIFMKVVSKFPLRLLAQLEAFKYCSRLQQTSYKVEPNVEIPRWTDSGFFAAERCARHTSSQAGINGSHVIIWTPANEPGYVGCCKTGHHCCPHRGTLPAGTNAPSSLPWQCGAKTPEMLGPPVFEAQTKIFQA